VAGNNIKAKDEAESSCYEGSLANAGRRPECRLNITAMSESLFYVEK
jgi:hypothetical protein